MIERMQTWTTRHKIVGDVRGRGLMIGVDLVRDRTLRTPAPEERDRIIQAAFERGLLLLGTGESAIRLSPPLIVSRDQADQAMTVLEECIRGASPA